MTVSLDKLPEVQHLSIPCQVCLQDVLPDTRTVVCPSCLAAKPGEASLFLAEPVRDSHGGYWVQGWYRAPGRKY